MTTEAEANLRDVLRSIIAKKRNVAVETVTEKEIGAFAEKIEYSRDPEVVKRNTEASIAHVDKMFRLILERA